MKKQDLTTVVGIGASAGGLEALERFFRAVRPHGNVAYVVVQHLSPEFKSMMGEILGKLTDLQIKPVIDQMELEPDTIYLNLPRTKLAVENGIFKQETLPNNQGENIFKPIDAFFSTLAAEYQKNAVAIILSGTGTDGHHGVQAVAQHGGLVLTQDLNSALFGSMPQAAKEAVTHSLSITPEEMPEIIQDYIRDPLTVSSDVSAISALDLLTEETALSFMLSLLQRKFQTDFTRYKPQTIVRRLERRMALDGVEHLADYARRAQLDDELLDQIYRELLIDVTRFFRDPDAFSWLETHLIPQLVQNKNNGDSLRIWVAACSSGEEAYSLAMLFLEEIERQNKQIDLRFFATDIHKSSIQFASEGKYELSALDQVPYHLGKKYFDTHASSVKVKKQLRQKIVFSVHDLLGDAYFGNQDLITCRNMLIYIRPKSQADILQSFTTAINPSGYLFLGPSEHLTNRMVPYFETLSRHWRIFQKVGSPHSSPQKPVRNVNIHLPKHLQDEPVQPTGNLYQGWEPALLKTLIPAGFVCNHLGELKEIYGEGKEYLNFSIGKVNLNLTELLADSLAIGLRNGLAQAQRKKEAVEISNIQFRTDNEIRIINLRVIPFEQDSINQTKEETDLFYLIILDEVRNMGQMAPIDPTEVAPDKFNELHSLKLELAFTRESLQATLEEVETSNEELQSSNEELTAANEELQSTNEELSSVNEELYTVNNEYQEQNQILNQLFNDKHNLERASGVLTIFLDHRLCIREMTPACYQAFDLIEADVGRPIIQFTTVIGLEIETLNHLVGLAIDGERSAVETLSHKKVPMLMSAIPYQGDRAELNGVILHFVDLTTVRQLEKENREMHSIADSIPVLMTQIGKDMRYRYVNQHFLNLHKIKDRASVIGKLPHEVIGEANAQILKPYHAQALAGNPVEFINDNFLNQKGRFAKNNFFPSWEGDEVDGFFAFAVEVTEFETERQKNLRELTLSQSRYKSIIETQPQLICRWRPDDFKITFSNHVHQEFFGEEVAEGKILIDRFSPKYAKTFKKNLAVLLKTGQAQTLEQLLEGPDGVERTIVWTDNPIFDSEGNIVEIQGIGLDVTEERAAQKKIALSEARYKSIVEHNPDLIDRYRPDDLIFTYLNEASAADYPPTKVGDSLLKVFEGNKKEIAAFKRHVAKIIKTGQPQRFETNHNLDDGTLKKVIWTEVPIFDEAGKIVEIQAVGRDISDIYMAQKELEDAHAQVDELFNHLPAWVAIVDTEYRFKFLNSYYQQNFGVDIESSINKKMWELSGPEVFEKEKPYYDRALKGEPVQYYSSIEEEQFEFHADIRLIPRKNGKKIVGFYLMGFNITELQVAKKELGSTLERLEAINDGLPVWISIIDKEHKFLYLNNFYNKTMEIDTQDSVGKHVKDVLGNSIYTVGKPYYEQALEGKTVSYLNHTGIKGDGRVALVTLVPAKGDVESDYFYLLAIDISEQIDAQNQLETALAQLEAVNDSLPIWISIVDKNYHYTYVNNFYMDSIGRKKEEFVGKHIQDALNKNFFKQGKPNYDRALAGERVDYQNKGIIAGEEVDIAVSLVPRKNNEGDVDSFFVLAVQQGLDPRVS